MQLPVSRRKLDIEGPSDVVQERTGKPAEGGFSNDLVPIEFTERSDALMGFPIARAGATCVGLNEEAEVRFGMACSSFDRPGSLSEIGRMCHDRLSQKLGVIDLEVLEVAFWPAEA
jgi:hypothetical protein